MIFTMDGREQLNFSKASHLGEVYDMLREMKGAGIQFTSLTAKRKEGGANQEPSLQNARAQKFTTSGNA